MQAAKIRAGQVMVELAVGLLDDGAVGSADSNRAVGACVPAP